MATLADYFAAYDKVDAALERKSKHDKAGGSYDRYLIETSNLHLRVVALLKVQGIDPSAHSAHNVEVEGLAPIVERLEKIFSKL
jgi:hypothetical protein